MSPLSRSCPCRRRRAWLLLFGTATAALVLARYYHLGEPTTLVAVLVGGGAPAGLYLAWASTSAAATCLTTPGRSGTVHPVRGPSRLELHRHRLPWTRLPSLTSGADTLLEEFQQQARTHGWEEGIRRHAVRSLRIVLAWIGAGLEHPITLNYMALRLGLDANWLGRLETGARPW